MSNSLNLGVNLAIAGADKAAQAAIQSLQVSSFLSPQHQAAAYLKCRVRTIYRWKQGNLQIPVATANPVPLASTSQTTPYVIQYTDTQTPNTQTSTQTQPPVPFKQRVSSEVVQTSAPYGKKIVLIEMVRIGAMPQLPDPTPSNVNQTLDDTIIQFDEPTIMPDMKTRIFSVTAIYVYNLTVPLWVPDGYNYLPSNQADGNSRQLYNFSSNNFVKGLI